MTLRRTGIALMLLLGCLAIALYALRLTTLGEAPAGSVDPAFEYHTRDHGDGYGGIDHWAYYGMRAERLAELLGKAGYSCDQPVMPAGTDRLRGIHDIRCVRMAQWPLARTLTVKASIDYDNRSRLVAASATSALDSHAAMSAGIADFLRLIDFMEPADLQIKGFEVDSIDMLSRLAVDALRRQGWHTNCHEDTALPECLRDAHERRTHGLPLLPSGEIAVIQANALHTALENVRLMPVVMRDARVQAGNDLLVRVNDARMWIDFTGQDLAGHLLSVSVELASEGGTPVQLIARIGTDTRVLKLAGAAYLTNDGLPKYLVPVHGSSADDQAIRHTFWLDLPSRQNARPQTLQQLASELPQADPAFIPRVVKVVLDRLAAPSTPEEKLGLYPALTSIEQRADLLRSAHAERWLPGERGEQWFREIWRDDPGTRAAWALARCESATRPPSIDTACWQRLIAVDADVTQLLRGEVAALQDLYAELPSGHPLRLRLDRLSEALAHE